MKTFTSSILFSLLLIVAAPAYSESLEVVHIFRCQFIDDTTTEDDMLELATAWHKAAKQTKGGENLSLGIRFPIAVGSGEIADFTWVIATPTFTEWGQFTDAYPGSPVQKVDDELFAKIADCGQSTMWEGVIMD